MGVFLRGATYWMSFSADSGQVRRSCGTANRKLALEIYHKQRTLIAEGRYLDKKVERPKDKFSDFAAVYLERHAKIYKKSWKSSDKSYLNHLLPVFGDFYLSDITSTMILKYMDDRCAQVKPASVNRELALLKVMYSKAEEWGYVSDTPTRKVKKLKGETLGRTRYLTNQEMERLLSKCDPGLREIVLVLIHTGMRKGEFQRMQWGHLDFDTSVIFVPISKNGKSRYIPMNYVVKQILLRRRIVGQQKAHYVFGDKDNATGIYNFRKKFETARKAAGLEDLRIHDLRHTFASHLVMKGVDLSTVQALLGHSDQRITERYSHLSPIHKAKAVKVLESLSSTFLAQLSPEEFQGTVGAPLANDSSACR